VHNIRLYVYRGKNVTYIYILKAPSLDGISTNNIFFDPHLHLAHIQNYSFVVVE